MNKRIVNCRFVCCGLCFDAAIDCDWEMHCYDQTEEEKRDTTPIELYCFDKPEWDIHMMYHKERNDQQGANYGLTQRICLQRPSDLCVKRQTLDYAFSPTSINQ